MSIIALLLLRQAFSVRPDLLQTTICNSDLILYTVGSACRPSDNKQLAGYAVVNDWVVIEA